VYYIHTDQLNTPRAITNASQTVVWNWDDVDAYGNNPANQNPSGTGTNFTFNLRFPGQYYDKETNLNYNYYRDFDPTTGRYVESDPVGLNGGLNTYAYAFGAPLTFRDPDGRWFLPLDAGLAVAGAVIGSTFGALSALQTCKPWDKVLYATLAGAAAGAVGGIAVGFGGTLAVGAVAGFVGDAAGTYVTGGDFNLTNSATAGIAGTAAGGITFGLAKLGIGPWLATWMGSAPAGALTLFGNYAGGDVEEGCNKCNKK
jgi:RHS repeat-associated protein